MALGSSHKLQILQLLQEWSKDQIVGLVSCFVWQERMEKGTRLREKLQGSFAELQQAARRVAKVQCFACILALVRVLKTNTSG